MMHEILPPSELFLREDGYYRPLCPVDDEYVAGEAVTRWYHREQSRRLKNQHESEMLTFDAELGELLHRMKQKLSRLGRNGGWSLWLRQQGIQRSTADRLVIQYAVAYGLTDDLHHRANTEPLEGNVCLAASRVSKRLGNMLSSPSSRLSFVTVLADLFGLAVEHGEGESITVSMTRLSGTSIATNVPNVIRILDDGTVAPVDYELNAGARVGRGQCLSEEGQSS